MTIMNQYFIQTNEMSDIPVVNALRNSARGSKTERRRIASMPTIPGEGSKWIKFPD